MAFVPVGSRPYSETGDLASNKQRRQGLGSLDIRIFGSNKQRRQSVDVLKLDSHTWNLGS